MSRLKIAVLFGGCSEEHDISVKSAAEIAKNLDREKYDPVYIGISKTGSWRLCGIPCADWEIGAGATAILSPDRCMHGILVLEDGGYRTEHIDAVLPVLHGKTGEDGAVQGLLELSGIPYAGCDIQSSALCMDKSLAYAIVKSAGISVPESRTVRRGEFPEPEGLAYPVFVKPARSGSSFGVSKVCGKEELLPALEIAGRFDDKILIEESVEGSEVGCAVLGSGDDLTTGEVDQICLKNGFFRIHQEKSPEKGSENATVLVPAGISGELTDRVKQTAKAVYRVLGCRGLARVDLFLKDDGSVVLNEVNTFPGCTVYSRYPRMMAAAGISMTAVIDKIITLALCRTDG